MGWGWGKIHLLRLGYDIIIGERCYWDCWDIFVEALFIVDKERDNPITIYIKMEK